MRGFDGLFWPDMDVRGRPAIVAGAAQAVPVVMGIVKGFDVVVQAGGNVGVYPIALAERFARVITFEPDVANRECLRVNVAGKPIEVRPEALGEAPGHCRIEVVEYDNCGAHKVVPGREVPVVCIDDLELPACDLIWLDIEGAEAAAIRGASKTIERFSPIVVLEEKGLGEIASLPGYRRVNRIGNDTVYVPC